MIDWVNTLAASPWSWDVTTVTATDTLDDGTVVYDTTVTAQHDTMLALADQAKWLDDTTQATIDQGTGVHSINNAMLDHTDLGMNLDEAYISHQLARTLDFRDDQNTQGVGANNQWMYEHDDNLSLIHI